MKPGSKWKWRIHVETFVPMNLGFLEVRENSQGKFSIPAEWSKSLFFTLICWFLNIDVDILSWSLEQRFKMIWFLDHLGLNSVEPWAEIKLRPSRFQFEFNSTDEQLATFFFNGNKKNEADDGRCSGGSRRLDLQVVLTSWHHQMFMLVFPGSVLPVAAVGSGFDMSSFREIPLKSHTLFTPEHLPDGSDCQEVFAQTCLFLFQWIKK